MAKLVQIEIKQADYDTLKSGHSNLCFAQKVDGAYTVLCQSISDFLPSTRFSWMPGYRLFGTNFFAAGQVVAVETNAIDAALVKLDTAVLDAAGVMKPATDTSTSRVIAFSNQYRAIHPGLIGTSAGPDGVPHTLPIHVRRDTVETGLVIQTPVDVVRVWFQQTVVTGTMLSADHWASIKSIDVDLTAKDTASLRYEDGSWAAAVME